MKHSNIPGKKPAEVFVCEALFSEEKSSINSLQRGRKRPDSEKEDRRPRPHGAFPKGLDESMLIKIVFHFFS